MKYPKKKWQLVTDHDVLKYSCGLKAGDQVRLLESLSISQGGKPTGLVLPKGQIWTVLKGSTDSPGVIWFRRPDGKVHTWDDKRSIFKTFSLVDE